MSKLSRSTVPVAVGIGEPVPQANRVRHVERSSAAEFVSIDVLRSDTSTALPLGGF